MGHFIKDKNEEAILKIRSVIKSISLLEQNIIQLKLEVSKIRLSILEKND